MARIRGVAILVHTDFGLQVFGQGPSWHIRHTHNPGHYDVIEPDQLEEGVGDISRDGAGKKEMEGSAANDKDSAGEQGPCGQARETAEGKQGSPHTKAVINKGSKTTLGGRREAKVLTINVGGEQGSPKQCSSSQRPGLAHSGAQAHRARHPRDTGPGGTGRLARSLGRSCQDLRQRAQWRHRGSGQEAAHHPQGA